MASANWASILRCSLGNATSLSVTILNAFRSVQPLPMIAVASFKISVFWASLGPHFAYRQPTSKLPSRYACAAGSQLRALFLCVGFRCRRKSFGGCFWTKRVLAVTRCKHNVGFALVDVERILFDNSPFLENYFCCACTHIIFSSFPSFFGSLLLSITSHKPERRTPTIPYQFFILLYSA